MKSGIYKIRSIANNWFYIGSAENFEKRWRSHKNRLDRNKHENTYLQNSWNKYGSDNFIFEIVEKWPIENLIGREQYWLDLYKPFLDNRCFNIVETAGGGDTFSNNPKKEELRKKYQKRKQSEESNRKRSITEMGNTNSIKNRKPIIQLTKDGQLVKEWNSANQIEKELGFHRQNICGVCRSRYGFKTAYGFQWKYRDTNIVMEKQ